MPCCACGQTATLGSQEGAFENVRMNYSGDQGQTIRQLITSHVLRRVGMCALTSPNSRRQHLAICSEKGKVTVLQLSALLRQAHSTKRKLTLTVCILCTFTPWAIKKRATLFLIITLAFLGLFFILFAPMERGRNTLYRSWQNLPLHPNCVSTLPGKTKTTYTHHILKSIITTG